MRRLPARVRLTAGFAAAMGLLLTILAWGTYRIVADALTDELDTGLRARAAAIRSALQDAVSPVDPVTLAARVDLGGPTGQLLEPGEAFAQVLSRDGAVLAHGEGPADPVLPPATVAGVDRSRLFDRRLAAVTGTARILAVPVRRGETAFVVAVGASTSDRDDTLAQVRLLLIMGGLTALALASFVGRVVVGRALGAAERMRVQAAAITAAGLEQRLAVPPSRDELSRLATTLNAMLGRLEDAQRRERRFLDQASHELRTPLSVLRTELDLALARHRSRQELMAALHSVQEETDRLCRLAEDLLVLSRAQNGRLPLRPAPTPLQEPLQGAADHFRTLADARRVHLVVRAPRTLVLVDGARVRQAVENLIDNALRYAPAGSTVSVEGQIDAGAVRIRVQDTGPGLPPHRAAHAFEPFGRRDDRVTRDAAVGAPEGTGLGLSIVRAIAQVHGGTATVDPGPGPGTRITVTLPRVPPGGVPGDTTADVSGRVPRLVAAEGTVDDTQTAG